MLSSIPLDLHCPIHPVISPYAEDAHEWLDGWTREHGIPDVYADRLAEGRIARYAARLYPDASASDLRVLSALFTWFFLIDDECDRASVPEPERVRALVGGALSLLRTGTGKLPGPLGTMLADAWREPHRRMPARWQARFVSAVEHHLGGVVVEARNKASGHRPGVEEYVELRRATSAAYVSHTLIDFAGGELLSESFYRHPAVRAFSRTGNDLLSWFNDLLSLERDAATAGGHNLVLALATERDLTIEEAASVARERWHRTMRQFPALREAVPPHGPAGRTYLDGVEHGVRGTMDWSFESARYT
ncbi:terpene synthase family protein [Phytohabitans kaempferiae]|uniref:Terpene synthase n=1 Tax=Phytohabitans kaempferiae TaxID=1620943 RepID=A0ABV6LWQ5_9ACTN